MPSYNQQNYPINCNFHRASSKHLITLTPKIYPFFSKSLSKILLANGLPGLLPVGHVRRQSYLPEPKIYLSRTTGRGLFRALTYMTPFFRVTVYSKERLVTSLTWNEIDHRQVSVYFLQFLIRLVFYLKAKYHKLSNAFFLLQWCSKLLLSSL